MDIFINNAKHDASSLTASTVAQALAAISDQHKDLVLVSVQLDGEQLDQQGLDDASQLPMSQPGKIELVFESRSQIAARALYDTADMLANDRRNYVDIAASLSATGLESAGEQLNSCFNNWVMAQQAITQSLGAVGLKLSDLPPQYQVQPLTKALTDALGHLQSRLKAGDSVAVADLLEYQLSPVADGWIALCNTLGQAIADGQT